MFSFCFLKKGCLLDNGPGEELEGEMAAWILIYFTVYIHKILKE